MLPVSLEAASEELRGRVFSRVVRKLPLVAAGVIGLGLLVAGCGGGNAGGEATVGPSGIDYTQLSGQIRMDGSSTVFPISEAVAEEFRKVAPDVRVNVAFSGTGGGFERLCRGEIEVSNASRPIKEDEAAACGDEGLNDVIELQVAIDALTIVANPGLEFLDCLTVQQLHDIFTGTTKRWNEIDSSWPDDQITLFFPGTDSGTFDYFVETIIEGVDENATHTGDGTASEDDNVLAQGIEGDSNGLGYFGFAYFQEAGQALHAVAVDGGSGCVEPTLEHALNGEYEPLSRPLFVYTDGSILSEEPAVVGLMTFYLENTNALTEEVGYVPLPDAILAAQVAKIEPHWP